MATVKIESNDPLKDILKIVDQLEINDLDNLLDKVLKLRAKKIAPSLSKKESSLLSIVNKPLPKKMQARFNILNQKRKSETLSSAEHEELIKITNRFEGLNVNRLKALGALSKIRKVPVRQLMEQLGITLKAA